MRDISRRTLTFVIEQYDFITLDHFILCYFRTMNHSNNHLSFHYYHNRFTSVNNRHFNKHVTIVIIPMWSIINKCTKFILLSHFHFSSRHTFRNSLDNNLSTSSMISIRFEFFVETMI